MKLFTDAIEKNGFIDLRYTCDMDNSSPELRWEDVPNGTQTLALICEDPDAPRGTFVHWVVYQIPGNVRHLPAGIPPQDALPNGIRQGLNSNRKLGYTGPCPPEGDEAHHYFFRLYALSRTLPIPARANAQQIMECIQAEGPDVLLATAEVHGLYRRMPSEFRRAG